MELPGSLWLSNMVGSEGRGVLAPGNLHGKLVGSERGAQEGGRRVEPGEGETGLEVKPRGQDGSLSGGESPSGPHRADTLGPGSCRPALVAE